MPEGPPYGDSADERAREQREKRQKVMHDWGFWSSPEDEGRQAHREKRQAAGKPPSKGCLDAVGKLVTGTVTAIVVCAWLRRR